MFRRHSQATAALGVRLPRLRWRDLATESVISVRRNAARSALTALGIVLGAAAFVSTLGLSSTLSHQVSASFDIRRATEVTVRTDDSGRDGQWYSPAALSRLSALNGVRAAGRRVTLGEVSVRKAIDLPQAGATAQLMGVDTGALSVIAPRLATGRLFDDFHDRQEAEVVLLPRPLADRLGVTRTQVAVFIGNQAYVVMGIYDDVYRRAEVMQGVLVPFGRAERLAAESSHGEATHDVLIATAPGAAQIIGAQAPFALSPPAPSSLRVIAPPDPRTLRREVESNVTQSSLLVSLVVLVIGAVSVGNSAGAAIAARTGEIGLRRSVGARPAHIFIQLLGETTMLGACGGVLGALIGVCVTSVVALWNGWTPVIDLRTAVVASAASAAAGLLAGLTPAARAMRVQPVAALQR